MLRQISVTKQRLSFIDALRGVAALAVVLYHSRDDIPAVDARFPWVRDVLEYGHFGVPIFFVLSGFVIALSLDGHRMNLPAVGRFMARRSIRLDPPYWVAIAIGIAVIFAKNHTLNSLSWPQVIAHFFYVQEILGYEQISVVFWTLCMEVQFYIVYSLLMCAPDQLFALAVAMAVSLLWPLHILPTLAPGLFLHLWCGFLSGVCAYWALKKGFPLLAFFGYVFLAALFGGSFFVVCALTASLILIVGLKDKLDGLNWRWIQGLGAISYSLYLLHSPVTGATFRIADRISKHTVVGEMVWWAISVVLCIAAAGLLWWAVERPSTSLARRLRLNSEQREKQLVTTSGARLAE